MKKRMPNRDVHFVSTTNKGRGFANEQRTENKEQRKATGLRVVTKQCTAFLSCFFLFTLFFFLSSCEQSGGSVRDDDATLRSLELDLGVLSPAFSASHFDYHATVRNVVDTVTVSAAANSGRARVSGAGPTPVEVGSDNTIRVRVAAESGDSRTYTVTVKRVDAGVKEITSAEDMAKIGVDPEWTLASEYLLVNNITLNNWRGVAGGSGEAFSGTFNGWGKTITLNGLALSGNDNTAGIFCRVEGNAGLPALIQNLTVNADVLFEDFSSDRMYAGLVAGQAKYTNFEGITVQGEFSAKNGGMLFLGGIAARAESSIIRGCTNNADIDGFGRAASGAYNKIGGIAGEFIGGTEITDCHNTGNIKGETTGASSNVFVGGIAGGTDYGFSVAYYGKIEGCSSTGNVHAEGGTYWSWAGGIAGTIVGYGNGTTERTRIVRSHASGRISINGPSGSWSYVGGIVAYNYFGALVEQCSFTGEVEVENIGVNDYAGGIAGYNSRLDGGRNSTVQDCWSSGKVTGYVNAGGIVGQNQLDAILRRCYSTMDVVVTAPPNTTASQANLGAGGIAGYSASAETDGIANNAALNTSVSAPNGFTSGNVDRLARVIGTTTPVYVASGFTAGRGIRNNYALYSLSVTVAGVPLDIEPFIDGNNGSDIPAKYLSGDKPKEDFYTTLLGWDFGSVWKMGSDGYPKLKWQ